MNLQVLVSTMHQKDNKLLSKMNIHSDAIIINQCDINAIEESDFDSHRIQIVNSSKRGLSKSRNDAIRLAYADVCLFADDDLVYCDNYSDTVLRTHQKYKDYDIIVFQVEGIEREFKKYCSKMKRLNYLASMKVSSVEISFKRKSITDHGIKMNELFGSGAKYCAGEENIFLFNCLSQKLKILYIPRKIANLHIGNSTWFSGYNQKYFYDKGAAFTAMSKHFSKLLILQFAIRHYKQYMKTISAYQVIRCMLAGRQAFLNESEIIS